MVECAFHGFRWRVDGFPILGDFYDNNRTFRIICALLCIYLIVLCVGGIGISILDVARACMHRLFRNWSRASVRKAPFPPHAPGPIPSTTAQSPPISPMVIPCNVSQLDSGAASPASSLSAVSSKKAPLMKGKKKSAPSPIVMTASEVILPSDSVSSADATDCSPLSHPPTPVKS